MVQMAQALRTMTMDTILLQLLHDDGRTPYNKHMCAKRGRSLSGALRAGLSTNPTHQEICSPQIKEKEGGRTIF